MTRNPRRSALAALALFVGGFLATWYHLATELHFAPGQKVATGSASCRHTPGSGHVPHSESDHDADRIAEEHPTSTFDADPFTVAPVFLEEPPAPPVVLADATLLLAHVPRIERPPAVWCSPQEQPRAPPVA